MSKIIKGNVYIPEGGKERKPKKHPQEILDTNTKALQLYANAWLNPETAEGQQRAMKLWHVMTRVSFDAQKTHRPDLTKGDFNCKECGTEGGRPTAPAFPYPMAPLHLIIPVRNDEDAAVVKALEAGKVPFESKATQRNRKKGHGRRPKDKVQEGRITKKRVQEKQKVLSEIRNEDLMESVGSFNLLD